MRELTNAERILISTYLANQFPWLTDDGVRTDPDTGDKYVEDLQVSGGDVIEILTQAYASLEVK